jgi:hypothetical protein
MADVKDEVSVALADHLALELTTAWPEPFAVESRLLGSEGQSAGMVVRWSAPRPFSTAR